MDLHFLSDSDTRYVSFYMPYYFIGKQYTNNNLFSLLPTSLTAVL